METRFVEAIETATGRKVRAFLSQIHIDPDISCEIFVLEPDGDRLATAGSAKGLRPGKASVRGSAMPCPPERRRT